MRRIVFIFVVALMLSFVSAGALAQEQTLPTAISHAQIPFQVNPLYEGLIDPADFASEPEGEPVGEGELSHTQPTFNSTKATYVTEEQAIEQLRGYMVNRTENFELYFTSENSDYEALINEMMMKALDHTGNATEGDYLAWHFAGWGGNVDWQYDVPGVRSYTYVIQVAYYTTADQEKELDTAVSQLLNSLDLNGKSDYEKVCAVYDYICANITYDYENLNNPDSWLQYTAYGALINKTAVCQGYANLLYRLLLELGIDNRIITGETLEGPHAWNIVKLGDVYYNADATWDAILGDHSYFLKNSEGFYDHFRYMDYSTTQFHTEYPMSETDYVDGVDGEPEHVFAWGVCGENAYWTIDRDGVLTIGGTGPLEDHPMDEPVLWDYWEDGFDTVVIEEGITSVGEYTFYGLKNLVRIELPESVRLIDLYAFAGCTGLAQIEFSEGLERIGEGAFVSDRELTELKLPTSLKVIDDYAFQGCDKLQNIQFKEGLETIGNYAFSYCDALQSISIPSSVTFLSGFTGCMNLSQVQMDNGGVIGKEAFADCDSLETIVIPEGITQIDYNAFGHNDTIEEITIPSSVTVIGPGAFFSCTNLKKVVLNNGGQIAPGAFQKCIELEEIVFAGPLEQIDDNVFMECTALSSVTLPESLTYLGRDAFAHTKVETICFSGDAPQFQENALWNITAVAYYPANNPTWTEEVMQQYGGTITWLPDNGQIPEEPEVPDEPVGLLGDVSGDGILDSYDATLILQYDVGMITADTVRLELADVSGDGIVDSYDATLILQYDVGMITKFPAA